MRIAVLAAADSWYFRDLARAAEGRHVLAALSYKRLVARARGAEATFLHRGDSIYVDAILVRSMPPGSLEQVVFRMDAL